MNAAAGIAAVRKAAGALVAASGTCVISSLDDEGFPAMRAMLAPREREGLKTMYFSTNTSSRHVSEFRADVRAGVYFFDPNVFQGLLLRGRIEVTTTQPLRDRVWRDGDSMYYPLGPTDPDYSVMIFTASNGRWYENFTKTDFVITKD